MPIAFLTARTTVSRLASLPLPFTGSFRHPLDFCDRKPDRVVLDSYRSDIRLCSPCGLKIPDNLSTVVDTVRAGTDRAGDKNWVECASHAQERVLVHLCINAAAYDLTAIVDSSEGNDSSIWAIQDSCEHTHIF